jgi:hypothetical protein
MHWFPDAAHLWHCCVWIVAVPSGAGWHRTFNERHDSQAREMPVELIARMGVEEMRVS